MADLRYIGFQLQLEDIETGLAVTGAGGQVMVVAAGGTARLVLADPLNNYAALANPVSLTRGGAQFAVLDTLLPAAAAGAPGVALVDLYIMGPEGDFVVIKGVPAGGGAATRPRINSGQRDQVLQCPYDFNDYPSTTEKSTGFVFPANCLIKMDGLATRVATTEAKLLSCGLLSTETGGSATGFMNVAPISAAAAVMAPVNAIVTVGGTTNFVAAAQTVGGKLMIFKVGADAANQEGLFVPLNYRTDGVAKTLGITPNTWAAAKGFFYIPYSLMNR